MSTTKPTPTPTVLIRTKTPNHAIAMDIFNATCIMHRQYRSHPDKVKSAKHLPHLNLNVGLMKQLYLEPRHNEGTFDTGFKSIPYYENNPNIHLKLFINPIATIIDHIIRNDHEVNEAFEIIPGTSMNAIYPIATTIKKTKQLTTNMKQIEDRQTSYSKYLNPSKWNHAYFLFEQDFYAEIDYDYLYKYLARGYTVDNIGRKTFTGYTSKFGYHYHTINWINNTNFSCPTQTLKLYNSIRDTLICNVKYLKQREQLCVARADDMPAIRKNARPNKGKGNGTFTILSSPSSQ